MRIAILSYSRLELKLLGIDNDMSKNYEVSESYHHGHH